MSADKIRMEMGFKNILDFGITFYCPLNVGINFSERVKNGGFSVAFEIISRVGKATGIDLFDFHV